MPLVFLTSRMKTDKYFCRALSNRVVISSGIFSMVCAFLSFVYVFRSLTHHCMSLLVPLGTVAALACCTSSKVLGAAKRVGWAGMLDSTSSSSESHSHPIGANLKSSLRFVYLVAIAKCKWNNGNWNNDAW